MAQSSRSYEASATTAELKLKVQGLLSRLDKGNFKEKQETFGFDYRFQSRFMSPWKYNIYIGDFNRGNTGKSLVRIEGRTGTVLSWLRVMELEQILDAKSVSWLKVRTHAPKEFRNLKRKSQVVTQLLNIVSPSLAVLYLGGGSSSPVMTSQQKYSAVISYLSLDILSYYIGGNLLFRTRHNASENQKFILAGLLATRAYGAAKLWNNVRAHNRLFGLNYSFAF